MVKEISRAAVAGLVLGAAVAFAPVAASAAGEKDVVAVRQAAMKQLGAHMKAIGGFLKGGKGAGTAADAALRGRAIAAAAAKMPAMFPKGTGIDDLGLEKTGAKAAIWRRRGDFEAAARTLQEQAMAFVAAAETGEKGRIGAAMGALGKRGCGGCHREFRQKHSH